MFIQDFEIFKISLFKFDKVNSKLIVLFVYFFSSNTDLK